VHSVFVFGSIEIKKIEVKRMNKRISFIHAADIHMDSPFKGLTHIPEEIIEDVQASTFTAFDQLVRTAIAKQVDFVLLVGDVFDHALHSLKAQVHVRNACETLQKHGIDVFMSFGNHDYLKGAPFQLTYPDNVYIFQSEEVTYFPFIKQGETYAHIYGFSYENQAVTTNKALEYEKVAAEVPFHIAMLHGNANQQTDHEPYAPFNIGDLLRKPFDYWALGHVHTQSILHENPWIVYPGNIQGRHRRETGAKGCYYVEMQGKETSLEFIPLHSIAFENIEIDAQDIETIEEFEIEIKKQMEQLTDVQTPIMVHITCEHVHASFMDLYEQGYVQECIDILNHTYAHMPVWKYMYKLRIESHHSLESDVHIEDHFFTELTTAWDDLPVESMLEPLFNHPQARKFLHPLTKEEQGTITKRAREELTRALMKK